MRIIIDCSDENERFFESLYPDAVGKNLLAEIIAGTLSRQLQTTITPNRIMVVPTSPAGEVTDGD